MTRDGWVELATVTLGIAVKIEGEGVPGLFAYDCQKSSPLQGKKTRLFFMHQPPIPVFMELQTINKSLRRRSAAGAA